MVFSVQGRYTELKWKENDEHKRKKREKIKRIEIQRLNREKSRNEFWCGILKNHPKYKMGGLHDISDSLMMPQLLYNVHYQSSAFFF